MSSRAKVTPAERLSIPADIRKRHGLGKDGDVVVEDTGDGILIRTIEQTIARAQAMSRDLLSGKPDAGVESFLADRRREAGRE